MIELHAMQQAGIRVKPRSLRPSIPAEAERCILKALQFVEEDWHVTVMEFVQGLIRGLRAPAGTAGLAKGGKTSHAGRLVPKMCDRRAQEDEFKSFLALSAVRCPGRTVFCLIHGDEGECHESLIERLAYSAESRAAVGGRDGDRPSTKILKVPWQYDGPVEVRVNRLVAWLFERFGIGNPAFQNDTSPAASGGPCFINLRRLRVCAA